MSDLVGNPEDRFSRVEAHLITYLFILVRRDGNEFCFFENVSSEGAVWKL